MFADFNSVIEDGQEIFVGITLVKRDGKMIVKSQFAKMQGATQGSSKRTSTKSKKTDEFDSLRKQGLSEYDF